MSSAQEYYDSLMVQGNTPELAKDFTQQHFPGFSTTTEMPAPVPSGPQPTSVPIGINYFVPQMAMRPPSDNSPIGYIAVFCAITTLILATWGVVGGTWLDFDVSDDTDIEEFELTLTHAIVEYDIRDFGNDVDCDEVLEGFDETEDVWGDIDVTCNGDIVTIKFSISNLCDEQNDAEMCDSYTAGLTAKVILWVAIVIGLIAALLISFNVFNIQAIPVNTQKFGMIAGISSGTLVAFAVILWMILLPDFKDTDVAYGLNVWLGFVAAVTGVLSGILVKTHGNPSHQM
ncbi:hypothetical protein N9M84_00105 [Candidatus Poseidoniales archaeon]|nr:hypothetical protein [Candidatus Poseidoniales archaeon]